MEHSRHLVHTLQIPIRWGDMDAMGHVNNSVYFRYAEQLRIDWLESIGFPPGQDPGQSPVIVNATCTFLVPLVYPGLLDLRMFIGQPGRSSLATFFEIRCAGGEKIYAEGTAKMIWTNPQTGKSIPLPDVMRRLASGSGGTQVKETK